MQGPDEASEHLDRPGATENVLNICNIHAELIAESLLHLKWDLAQACMDGRNTLIRDRDLREVWVLEEPVVRLTVLDAESDSSVSVGVVAAGLRQWNLSTREHLDMAPVFVLNGALYVLGSGHVLDLNARAFILVALH